MIQMRDAGVDPAVAALIALAAAALFLLGYLEIRARFAAERRARLLATLVDVGHAVGTSLDPVEVFRAVHARVRAVLDVDAFYVCTLSPRDPSLLDFRFLVDASRELPPTEQPREGSVAGYVIERDQPVLISDADRNRPKHLPPRRPWGTVVEKSIMVVPLRIRGKAFGAISTQSVRPGAYDQTHLDLLASVANEAAIAIERAQLYEHAAALSRRLFDLHRIGIELAAQREVGSLIQRLCESVALVIGSTSAAVYLDRGGDVLEYAHGTGGSREVPTLSKDTAVGPALLTGQPVEISHPGQLPDPQRQLMEKYGLHAVLIQPLRAAEESIGVLFVAWTVPHAMTDDEKGLVGVLAGIGATAIRSLRLYGELDDAYLSTVHTLTATIQARDGYREDHQLRVAADAVALGERLGLGEGALRDLRYASLFHALGKIAIPQSILSKKGPLTAEERRIVQEHPVLGARLVESIAFLRGVVPIVRHANERWDGSGYPDGLAHAAIPLAARILAVAIAYEAALAERPYRAALRPEAALVELRSLAGVAYDPSVVSQFVSMVEGRGVIAAVEREAASGSRELAILAEVTLAFHALLDLDQLLGHILGILARHLPGSQGVIYLVDEQSDELLVRSAVGDDAVTLLGSRRPAGRGIAGWVYQHREAQVVDDVRADARSVAEENARAVLAVPLLSEGRAIGVIGLVSRTVGAFSRRDLTLVQAIAAQIAAAIEVAELHERLKRAANTDVLTGLHNYRYFYDRLEEEIARSERRATPLAVAYFDIDGLKRVNDSHGHLAGDEVLRTLGRVIAGNVRAEDVPARYGGDEFAIVMPETPRDEAERVVARLMELVDHTEVKVGSTHLKMPARSWGVASYPVDGTTARELVENADTRVYAAKRSSG